MKFVIYQGGIFAFVFHGLFCPPRAFSIFASLYIFLLHVAPFFSFGSHEPSLRAAHNGVMTGRCNMGAYTRVYYTSIRLAGKYLLFTHV